MKDDRLMAAIRQLVDSRLDELGIRYAGSFEYVVVAVSGEIPNVAVDARPVDESLGLPDLAGVSMLSGIVGGSSVPKEGETIILEFLDRNPAKPRFVAGSSDVTTASLDGQGKQPVARMGDSVSVYAPPAMPIAGTLSGAPFTGILTITGPFIGSITTGNKKVTA